MTTDAVEWHRFPLTLQQPQPQCVRADGVYS